MHLVRATAREAATHSVSDIHLAGGWDTQIPRFQNRHQISMRVVLYSASHFREVGSRAPMSDPSHDNIPLLSATRSALVQAGGCLVWETNSANDFCNLKTELSGMSSRPKAASQKATR